MQAKVLCRCSPLLPDEVHEAGGTLASSWFLLHPSKPKFPWAVTGLDSPNGTMLSASSDLANIALLAVARSCRLQGTGLATLGAYAGLLRPWPDAVCRASWVAVGEVFCWQAGVAERPCGAHPGWLQPCSSSQPGCWSSQGPWITGCSSVSSGWRSENNLQLVATSICHHSLLWRNGAAAKWEWKPKGLVQCRGQSRVS